MWKASLGSSPELALLDGGKTETLLLLETIEVTLGLEQHYKIHINYVP